ncbi:MAG: TIGR04282 family arsenosugar biosynthesis glycosyltransferase [Myxococcota bacterium]
MRGALIVFARRPEPGRVKTRLSPPLSPEQAAELYGAMLDDVLEVSAEAARIHELELWLVVTPAGAVAELSRRCPAGFQVFPQQGRDLSERMSRALAMAVARGVPRILLRGSDSPGLEATCIGEALQALGEHDVVACPDRDGGYALIGLRGEVPGIFAHPMGTERVLRDTLEAAGRLGLRSHLLPGGFDIDRIEDLRWLAAARSAGRATGCPRTLRYLDANSLWKLAGDASPEAPPGGDRAR